VRRSIPIALVVLAVVLPAAPANAGGNWLDFRRDRSVESPSGRDLGTWAVMAAGQRIVAHTAIWAPNPHRRDRLSDTTYFAWLSPGESYFEGTTLPADAVRLAPFRVRWFSNTSATVRARFTVPDIPPGEYEVLICDDPCTLSGFGEYVQGWITVKQTPEEARLFALAQDRKWRAHDLARMVRRLREETAGLEHRLAVAERTLGMHAGLRQGSGRAGAFEPSSSNSPEAATRPIVPGWAVLALALAIVAAAAIVRRPRPFAFEIPDTVPDDLVERDRVEL
jgi:hypothetical protein